MTKKQYRKKCQKLFCKAKRLGVKLKFHQDWFHHQRLNCLWHGGTVAEIIVSKELSIELNAYGDVRATLYDEHGEELAYSKDKSNTGAFEDNMYHISGTNGSGTVFFSGARIRRAYRTKRKHRRLQPPRRGGGRHHGRDARVL